MILGDAHVHFYDCFDLQVFFNSAYDNFKFNAHKFGQGHDFKGFLLLSETSKDNWFKLLFEHADGKKLPNKKTTGTWKIHHTDECQSLCARSEDNRELLLISGRQVVSAERLELLALATIDSFQDGTPLKELIEFVRKKNGIPVIPWGLGKWMGQRGAVVTRLIHTMKESTFFMGDSGMRPFVVPYPSQLKIAKKHNISDLPGSDPLPFQTYAKVVGSSGFCINDEAGTSKPSSQLKDLILNKRVKWDTYMRPVSFPNFVISQLMLRLRKNQ
jgi:hypothetical protein